MRPTDNGGERTVNRRDFFRLLLGEAVVFFEEILGVQHKRTSEIASLPDALFLRIVPVRVRGCELCTRDGELLVRHADKTDYVVVAEANRANSMLVNAFDGKISLGEAVVRLAALTGWDQATCVTHTRQLFIALVTERVFLPRKAAE